MAQKRMRVQVLLYCRLVGKDRPLSVMAIVGDRGFTRCGAVWLMGLLSQGVRTLASGHHCTLHFDSIKVYTVIRILPNCAIGQGRERTD